MPHGIKRFSHIKESNVCFLATLADTLYDLLKTKSCVRATVINMKSSLERIQ